MSDVHVWHKEPPELNVWRDGREYHFVSNDGVIAYEERVQIGSRMTEWGVPFQSSVNELARINSSADEPHRLQSMWECGRAIGHREGYEAAMADIRKLLGVKP